MRIVHGETTDNKWYFIGFMRMILVMNQMYIRFLIYTNNNMHAVIVGIFGTFGVLNHGKLHGNGFTLTIKAETYQLF